MSAVGNLRATTQKWASGDATRGIIWGLTFRVPGSGATVTYTAGLVRTGFTAGGGVTTKEFRVAGGTKAFTTSSDTYVVVDNTGTLQYYNVATDAAKPSQDTVGVDSEFLYKVVVGASDVSAIKSLARVASHGPLVAHTVRASLQTNEKGAIDYFHLPFAGRIVGVEGVVQVAIAASNNGTVTPAIGVNDVFTDVTNGVLTAVASDALAVRYTAVPSAAHSFGEGDVLRTTTAKSTAGGVVETTYHLEAY